MNKPWNFDGAFGVLSTTMLRFVAIALLAASSGYFVALAGAPKGALASGKDPRSTLPDVPEATSVIDLPTLRANDKLVLENRELRRVIRKLEKDLDERRIAVARAEDELEVLSTMGSLSVGTPQKVSLLGESRSGDRETSWGSVSSEMQRTCTKTFRPDSALDDGEREDLHRKRVSHSQIMHPVPGGIVLTSCEEEFVTPVEERWSESIKDSSEVDQE